MVRRRMERRSTSRGRRGPRGVTGAVRYEIRIRGELSETVLGAFPDLHVEPVRAETALVGTLADQAALHAVLAQIEALGLELIEVRRTI